MHEENAIFRMAIMNTLKFIAARGGKWKYQKVRPAMPELLCWIICQMLDENFWE